MAQKTKNGQNFAPKNTHLGWIPPVTVAGHNSPSEWARELFKPSKDSWSHVVCNKKNILHLAYGFSVDVYIMRGCLCTFVCSLMTSSRHPLTQIELAYGIFVLWFRPKNSNFQLPYQRPSSSADCARELFNGSNGSASLVDCTWKKFFCLGGAGFLWVTS